MFCLVFNIANNKPVNVCWSVRIDRTRINPLSTDLEKVELRVIISYGRCCDVLLPGTWTFYPRIRKTAMACEAILTTTAFKKCT